jgi:hypothetical protein
MTRTVASIRTALGRHKTTRLALAITGLTLAGLSPSVAASASPASPASPLASPALASPSAAVGTFIFASGAGHLVGDGHNWNQSVEVESLAGSPAFNIIAFGISTAHLGGTESHFWGGQLPASDLSVNSAAVMTITSRSSLSPVASLQLTFKPTSRTTSTRDCVTGKEVIYTGTFKGSLRLTTGMRGLSFSAAHLSFGSHNTLTELKDCVFSPCHAIVWSSISGPAKNAAFAAGTSIVGPGHPAAEATIQRSVTLPGTNTLSRTDMWSIKAKPPTFSKSSKSLSLTGSPGGLVTGAGTLSHGVPSGSPPGTPKTCHSGGKNYRQTDTQYLNARYDPAQPFEAHSILNGIVKVPQPGTGRFDIVTVK